MLIFDELGYVPASKLGAELLFDVISTAYERTSLIVTTNLPFENWTELLGSERLTGATLDRLTHRCHILETAGESYRLADARRRETTKPKPKKTSREKIDNQPIIDTLRTLLRPRQPWEGAGGPLSPTWNLPN